MDYSLLCLRRMKRKFLSLLALGITLLLGTQAKNAEAQTTSNAIPANVEVSLNDDQLENGPFLFVGKSSCSSGKFTFELSNYKATVPVLEVWVAEGGTVDCSTAASRQSSGNATSTCWRVASKENVQATNTVSIEVPGVSLFDRAAENCPAKTNQKFVVHFVPLQSATQDGTGNASEPSSNDTRRVTFTLYTQPPAPPTDVKPKTGEESVGVSWTAPADTDKYTKYRVYYDLASVGTGDCNSEALVADAAPAADKGDLVDTTETATSGTLGNLDGRLEVGESIATAVVTVDAGGNESALSEVVCVERVLTEGFLDRYKRQGGDGLTECSVHLWKRNSFSPLAALFLLALGLAARRRLS